MQRIQWKESRMTHIAVPEIKKREVVINSANMGGMFRQVRQNVNTSRTNRLNSSSIVNTSMPLMGGHRVINRNYNNMGRMW